MYVNGSCIVNVCSAYDIWFFVHSTHPTTFIFKFPYPVNVHSTKYKTIFPKKKKNFVVEEIKILNYNYNL